MKVTYIGHSGFLLEWKDCFWLFDYYEGNIPIPSVPKPLYVFSSHSHGDHFNPAIFSIAGFSKICYILSHDIMKKAKRYETTVNADSIHFMKARQKLLLPVEGVHKQLEIQTLPSTDCGVAFLVRYEGKLIYHAGDLNWWVWPGESKQYNNNMTANFKNYTAPLIFLPPFFPWTPVRKTGITKDSCTFWNRQKTSIMFSLCTSGRITPLSRNLPVRRKAAHITGSFSL